MSKTPIDLKQLEVVRAFSERLFKTQTILLDMLRPSMLVWHPLPIDRDINYHDTLPQTSMHLRHRKFGDHNPDPVLDLVLSILRLPCLPVIPPEKGQT